MKELKEKKGECKIQRNSYDQIRIISFCILHFFFSFENLRNAPYIKYQPGCNKHLSSRRHNKKLSTFNLFTAPKIIHNQIQILLLCDLNGNHNEDKQNFIMRVSVKFQPLQEAWMRREKLRARKYVRTRKYGGQQNHIVF